MNEISFNLLENLPESSRRSKSSSKDKTNGRRTEIRIDPSESGGEIERRKRRRSRRRKN